MASDDNRGGPPARGASGKPSVSKRQGRSKSDSPSSILPTPVRRGMQSARRAGREMREHLPQMPPLSAIPTTIKKRMSNPQAELKAREGLSPEAALNATYNFRRGVWNGIMFTLVDGLIAPSLVLALFINRLGAP
ncbi:MAG: hypothetical protein ABIQ44_13930, partial [Chloroflexia bacterium]